VCVCVCVPFCLCCVRRNSATGSLIEFRQSSSCLCPTTGQRLSGERERERKKRGECFSHVDTPGTVWTPGAGHCRGCKIQSNSFSILFDLTRELARRAYRSFFLFSSFSIWPFLLLYESIWNRLERCAALYVVVSLQKNGGATGTQPKLFSQGYLTLNLLEITRRRKRFFFFFTFPFFFFLFSPLIYD
jgi:hypothetical protein